MPLSLLAAALCLTPPKLLWNQVLFQTPGAVEKRLGAPTRKELTPYIDYDPRWIKWVANRGRDSQVTDHELEIQWDLAEYAIRDADLWNGNIPRHAQAKGNWIAYLGAPLAKFEKVAGKAVDTEAFEDHGIRTEDRTYRLPKLGEAKVTAAYLNPKAPVVIRIGLTFGPKVNLDSALKTVGVDRRLWKDTKENPNFDATLFFPLGAGVLRECTYAYGPEETLRVAYAGPKGKETAQSLALYSDGLKGLVEAAARFRYRVLPKDVVEQDGTQSDWTHLRTHALFLSQPSRQLVIASSGVDLNDLR
ncbi:hypothetical protein EON79_07930 [bacterium]|nr:MAG: hypothetical protein EON79_07930 [bacterium]